MKNTGERLHPEVHNRTMVEHVHRYAIARDFVTGRIVLDLACGEGYGSLMLSATAKHVFGVDISKEAVEFATSRYAKSNLQFLHGSATEIPLPDNSVDVAVSFETLEHLQQHDEMIREFKRVMTPDGILIISTPDKKYYSDATNYSNPFHVRELYESEFQGLLGKYFPTVRLYKQGVTRGSLIYESSKESHTLTILHGDAEKVTMDAEIHSPEYMIAIASENNVPCSGNSLFESVFVDSEMQSALEYQKYLVASALSSRSYKIGRLVTSPFRLVRKMFKRSNK